MLDPLLAAGLAGNVVTFIDFSAGIVRRTKQLADSSLPNDLKATQKVCNDLINSLQRTLRDLKPKTVTVSTASDSELLELARDVLEEMIEFRGNLELMSIKTDSDIWKRFRRAVKIAWKGSTLQDLQGALDKYQATYSRHLLERNSLKIIDMRDEMRLMHEEQRETSDGTTSQLHQLSTTIIQRFDEVAERQDESFDVFDNLYHIQHGILKGQEVTEGSLQIALSWLEQLSTTANRHSNELSRAWNHVSQQLCLLRNHQQRIAHRQEHLLEDMRATANSSRETISSISNIEDTILKSCDHSTSQLQSVKSLLEEFRISEESQSESLHKIYGMLKVLALPNSKIGDFSEPSLYVKMQLPSTNCTLELAIRQGPDNGQAGFVSVLTATRGAFEAFQFQVDDSLEAVAFMFYDTFHIICHPRYRRLHWFVQEASLPLALVFCITSLPSKYMLLMLPPDFPKVIYRQIFPSRIVPYSQLDPPNDSRAMKLRWGDETTQLRKDTNRHGKRYVPSAPEILLYSFYTTFVLPLYSKEWRWILCISYTIINFWITANILRGRKTWGYWRYPAVQESHERAEF